MASYENSFDPQMTEDAVNEYLTVAKYCLDAKNGSGCFGFPASLLLLCTIDAIGSYLRGEEVMIEGKPERITEGEPFRVLNHRSFDLGLTGCQIKYVEQMFRHQLAHNGMIAPGCHLNADQHREAFVFSGPEAEIRLRPLYTAVQSAWNDLDKSRIRNHLENPDLREQLAKKAKCYSSPVLDKSPSLPTPDPIIAATGSPLDPTRFTRKM